MAKPIDLAVTIDAPIDRVWAELADFASHPEWMDDAATVRFLTEQTTGVGTRIEVATRVGPLRATDFMNVVGWVEGQTIVVEHMGSVTGSGRFEVRPLRHGHRDALVGGSLDFPGGWADRLVWPSPDRYSDGSGAEVWRG